MKEILHRLKPHLIPTAIIALFGLVLLTYFRDGLMIFGSDAGLWSMNADFQLYTHSYTWTFHELGDYSPYHPLHIPYLAVLYLFDIVGLPAFLSEAFLMCLIYISIGLSMYFLAITLSRGRGRLMGVAAALFYMFNTYMLLRFGTILHPVWFYGIALLPFMLALLVRGLNNSEKWLRNGTIFGLGSLLFVSGYHQVAYIYMLFITLLLYFVFHLLFISENGQRVNAVKFVTVAATISILVNLWWLIPMASLGQEGMGWYYESQPFQATVSYFSQHSSFLRLFQMQGDFAWGRIEATGQDFYQVDQDYLGNPFLIITSFLPVVLFVMAWLLQPKVKNIIKKGSVVFLFFALFYLLSLFLAKGTHEPLGGLNWFLFEKIPGFVVFRSVFIKFGSMMTLGLAILFGFSLDILYHYLKDKRIRFWKGWHIPTRIITIVVIAVLLLGYNYPFFSGMAILTPPENQFYITNAPHKLPQSYLDAADWINDQPGHFRILSLPMMGGFEFYNWEGQDYVYLGADPLLDLMEKPIIHAGSFTGGPLNEKVYASFHDPLTPDLAGYLGLQNVKYLMVHNDANSEISGYESAEYVRERLLVQPNIHLERTFGQLEFYRVDDEYFIPVVYATNELRFTSTTMLYHEELPSYPPSAEISATETVISASETIADYIIGTGTPKWEVDSLDKNEGSASITFTGLTTFVGELSIKYDPPGTWDWSEQKTLTLDVKIESTAEVGFRLYVGTVWNQYGYYEYESVPNGVWVKIVAQLDQYSGEYVGGLDMASVDWIELNPLGEASKPITAWVDDIRVDVASEVDHGVYLRRNMANVYIDEELSPIILDRPGEIAYSFVEQTDEDEIAKIKALRAGDFYQPDITFENINPTKYRIQVNADEPFSLILSEFYHWGWKAYSGDVNWLEALFSQPISPDEHFIANGYANAWHIDETGDYDITLYFWPQSLFYGGLVVTLLTIVGCVSYLFWPRSLFYGRFVVALLTIVAYLRYLIISKIKHKGYHSGGSHPNG